MKVVLMAKKMVVQWVKKWVAMKAVKRAAMRVEKMVYL